MKELKNDRDVLQALLDGETIQRTRHGDSSRVLEWWVDKETGKMNKPSCAETIPCFIEGIRIKPKTVNINGYEVPEPLREEPDYGTKYYNALGFSIFRYTWENGSNEREVLKEGFLHLTEEAALLHRKALASFTTLKKEGINEDI